MTHSRCVTVFRPNLTIAQTTVFLRLELCGSFRYRLHVDSGTSRLVLGVQFFLFPKC